LPVWTYYWFIPHDRGFTATVYPLHLLKPQLLTPLPPDLPWGNSPCHSLLVMAKFRKHNVEPLEELILKVVLIKYTAFSSTFTEDISYFY